MRFRQGKCFGRSILLAAVVAFGSGRALAQTTAEERVAAEALFDEGRRLLSNGQFAPACEKLEQSQRIDPAVGTLLYLAECYEKSGRTASAWATFREASSAARASGQAERGRVGQERAAKLESKLVRLTLRVADENARIEGFQVKRRGEIVPRPLWGEGIPVDPGEQTVEASAPGYQAFTQKITVDTQPAQIDVPPLVKLPVVETAPKPAEPPRPLTTEQAVVSAPHPDEPPARSGIQRTLGYTIGAAGIVGVGIGAVFGLTAKAKNDDAKASCSGTTCSTKAGKDSSDEAGHAAVGANIGFALGGAALVTGIVLVVTAPPKTSGNGVSLRILPSAGSDGVGARLRGTF